MLLFVDEVAFLFLGMDGVDKEKVQRIVYEMSKGSKYFENEERKEALMRQRTENMRDRCGKLSTADISHYQKVCFSGILVKSSNSFCLWTIIVFVQCTGC